MKKEPPSKEDTAWLALIGVVAGALVIAPALLSVLAWFLVARYLGKKESWALLGVGLLAWVLFAEQLIPAYFGWLKDIVTGDFAFAEVPWGSLGAGVLVFTGLCGAVSYSRFGSRLPQKLRPGTAGSYTPFASDELVPDGEQKSKLRPAAADGMFIDKTDHLMDKTAERGKRKFPIGYGVNGQPIYLSEKEIRTHGFILGATGSGKSETIKAIAGALLDLGWSGLLLDLKEDTAPGGLRDWCNTYAQVHGLPFQELRLSDPNSRFWYNAMHGMGPDEIRDMILTTEKFDAAYWAAINKEMLGQAVNLLVYAHTVDPERYPSPTLLDLGLLLASGDMKRASMQMRATVLAANLPGVSENEFSTLANPSKDHASSAYGFGARFTGMYNTAAGKSVLRDDPENPKRLLDVTAPGLVYVGLDSQGKADLTKVISSSILQRMSVYAAMRVTGQVAKDEAAMPRFLIVDEANWVDRTIVQNLLSRARSAGIAMLLCTQGPKDWIDENGDDWGRLTQNTNVAIIMRQGEPDSAKLCADYLGTQKVIRQTTQRRVQKGMFGFETEVSDGIESSSVSEDEDYIVGPEQLRTIEVGEAIVKVGVPARVEWAQITMRDPTKGPR